MAFWLLNYVPGDDDAGTVFERVGRLLDAAICGVPDDDPRRDSLAVGDLVLVYLGAPARVFLASAEIASPVRRWTAGESPIPGTELSGVRVGQVARWNPPVAMAAVLARIDPANRARADFDRAVVGITPDEYQAAVDAAESGGP